MTISKVLLLAWAALSVLFVIWGISRLHIETRDVVAAHREGVALYLAELEKFNADCEKIQDFSEFRLAPLPPLQPGESVFARALRDLDPKFNEPNWQRGRSCLPENREQTGPKTALARAETVWTSKLVWEAWAKTSNISFSPAALSYNDILSKSAYLGNRIIVLIALPLSVLGVGYIVRSVLRSRIIEILRAEPSISRVIVFLCVAWIVIYPMTVFFFGTAYIDESEYPERTLFGYWLFIPAAVLSVWVGIRRFGR